MGLNKGWNNIPKKILAAVAALTPLAEGIQEQPGARYHAAGHHLHEG